MNIGKPKHRLGWISVVLACMILAPLAVAQAPTPTGKMPRTGQENAWEFSAQYLKPTNDWGPNWHFNGAKFDITRAFGKRWGVVGEFDFSGANGHDAKQYAYRVGPRVNLITGHKIVPYGQFLFGGSHMSATNVRISPPESTWFGFTWLAGGGLDILFSHHWGVRGEANLASLPQGTHGVDRDYWPQYSGGVLFRW